MDRSFHKNEYRNILLDSVKHCQKKKGFRTLWVLFNDEPCPFNNRLKRKCFKQYYEVLKRHTSEELHKAITNNKTESRKEWMEWMMERAAKKTSNNATFQLWQPENHPIELSTQKITWQKLDYIHYNPVEAGFVNETTDWLYSSAIDYNKVC